MAKNTILIIVAVLLVLVFIGAFYYFNFKPETAPVVPVGGGGSQQGEGGSMPEATGSIDDAVDALLQSADAEVMAAGNPADDKALIISDSQEVSGFSQSAGENEF